MIKQCKKSRHVSDVRISMTAVSSPYKDIIKE